MSFPLLVQMAGHAGSGKSTLARQIADRFGGVTIDLDVVKTALLDAGVDWAMASSASYETIFALAEDLLRAGTRCVIVDSPSYWAQIYERLTASASATQARYVFLECEAAEALRAQRLADRPAKRSQIQVLGVAPSDAPQQDLPAHSRQISRPVSSACLLLNTGSSFDLEALFSDIGTLAT
jgi:predicted kinase